MEIKLSETLKDEIERISFEDDEFFIDETIKDFGRRIENDEPEAIWIKYAISLTITELFRKSMFAEGSEKILLERRLETLEIYSKYFGLSERQKKAFKKILY